MDFILVAAGALAGFIDSIAGGGGLITVPIFSLLLGPGATAIGTNKIVAVISTAVALLVYLRGGHVSVRGNRRFAVLSGVGALGGAALSPLVPAEAYRWLIVAVVPVILFILFRKDIWVKQSLRQDHARTHSLWFWIAGVACGFYDGIAGPGGGTLMFLSLFVLARLPLLLAMATAKIANLASASASLLTFSISGHVVWNQGFLLGVGIGVGAFLGASLASRNAAPYARAALLVVSLVLTVRLIFS